MPKHIIIHKTNAEGLLLIDALDGSVITAPEERPDWAEGLAAAMLAERNGWYEKRLGKWLPDALRSPQSMNADDLTWIGVDHEGDEVEIEASTEYRTDILATLLEIDTSADSFELPVDGEVASALVDYTYMTAPTDEQTLAEAEAQDFGETETSDVRKVSNGS